MIFHKSEGDIARATSTFYMRSMHRSSCLGLKWAKVGLALLVGKSAPSKILVSLSTGLDSPQSCLNI